MTKTLLQLLLVALYSVPAGSQSVSTQDPREMVKRAVRSEIAASREDHSLWRYRDDERVKATVSNVVETREGSVKRLIERGGRTLPDVDAKAEEERIQALLHDPAKLAKQKKDSAADDKSAAELLEMLPRAFTWKLVAENADAVTLAFEPESTFNPPDMQSRVLGTMRGELVVDRKQQRIRTIKGTLTQDVLIGFGMLGRLKQGGTFDVERREVKPGLWQITETHVHIDGKALFFKNIGQQQDEIQTDFREVPGGTTLEQAADMSKVAPGSIAGR